MASWPPTPLHKPTRTVVVAAFFGLLRNKKDPTFPQYYKVVQLLLSVYSGNSLLRSTTLCSLCYFLLFTETCWLNAGKFVYDLRFEYILVTSTLIFVQKLLNGLNDSCEIST